MRTPDFYDDFSRGLDSRIWSSWGDPSPYVQAGQLYIPFDPQKTKNTVGVSMRDGQTYGTWHIRMKATDGKFKTCPNLWPKAGWIAEYDIAEGPDRDKTSQTLHYLDGHTHLSKGNQKMIHGSLSLKAPGLTDWTTVRCEWTQGRLRTTTSRSVGQESLIVDSHVPDYPMALHIQTGHPSSGAQAGFLVVDWIKVWK